MVRQNDFKPLHRPPPPPPHSHDIGTLQGTVTARTHEQEPHTLDEQTVSTTSVTAYSRTDCIYLKHCTFLENRKIYKGVYRGCLEYCTYLEPYTPEMM